jgi:hypothetical protein
MCSRYAEAFDRLLACLDDVAGAEPIYRSAPEKQQAMLACATVINRAQALQARILAAADDVAEATGHRSPSWWLAEETHDAPAAVKRTATLGALLEARWPGVRQSFGAGGLNLRQTQVIVDALERLPQDLDVELLDKAEALLLTEAAFLSLRELRTLGDRLLDRLAPEIADRAEYERVLAEERRAAAETRLTFGRRGDGTTDLFARFPTPVANRLRAYLDAYVSPRRHGDANAVIPTADDEVRQLPLARQRGIGFVAFLENLPADDLPSHGGAATTVTVTVDLAGLLADVGVATTSTGDSITVGHARRLACTAGILPVVLGGDSEILDVGRRRRLVTGAIRTALNLRDRGCTATGCTMPASFCEGHHTVPWSRGGDTSLKNSTLLCSFHHHRAHDPGWQAHHEPNGQTRFTRRQ